MVAHSVSVLVVSIAIVGAVQAIAVLMRFVFKCSGVLRCGGIAWATMHGGSTPPRVTRLKAAINARVTLDVYDERELVSHGVWGAVNVAQCRP